MKFLIYLSLCLLLVSMETSGRKFKMKTKMTSDTRLPGFLADDALLDVEPIPPMIGECQCKCCDPAPEPYAAPPCVNDVVVAVDSSACFRDHHGRMMRFLKKLVRKIGKTEGIQYGGTQTRLGLQQFSSDIIYPLSLSSFEHYTNPSSRKALMEGINAELSSLAFLGEGSFLNKALNSSANHFQSETRPLNLMEAIAPATPRRILIVMTNGKSHPDVTMTDIENSISGLSESDVMVFPVSVTRECHGVQSDIWNEGLCPDTVTLNRLAKVGRSEGATFMEMTSQDTVNEILNQLKTCQPEQPVEITGPSCNNCTCSCELPIGPRGPEGPQGDQGQSIKGEVGEKGDIGPPGPQGEEGPQGETGEKGKVGSKGEVGDKGDQGEVGPKGDQGEVGEKGDEGVRGPKGDEGQVGAKGDEGEQGPKGDVGEKGDFGQKGEEGNKGEVGDKGDQGVTGDKGEVGVGIKGEKGEDGIEGPKGGQGNKGGTGEKGEEGRQGLCGQPGPAGTPGDEGIPGTDGIDGNRGPQGIQGPRGDRGERGETGEPGIPGEQGFPGELGLTGERGPEGPQGSSGRKGEKGEPSNERGVPGRTGPFGPKGEPGADGSDGLDGAEGPPGVQGPRGSTGPRGPEGTINLEELRPIIADIVRELIPAECASDATRPQVTTEPNPPPTPADGFGDGDDICGQPRPSDDCNPRGHAAGVRKYYWDNARRVCILFNFFGCQGSNVFDSERECLATCLYSLPPTVSTITTSAAPATTLAPTFDETQCTNALTDLAFVMDGSSSVGENGFSLLRDFLTNVVSGFDDVSHSGVQVAMIQYNERPRMEFNFPQSTSKRAVLDAIDNLEFLSGNTQTGAALEFLQSAYDEIEGARPNARKVVVVITDGRSQDDVKPPATTLKNGGAIIFAIGVGEAERYELTEMASSPLSQYIFSVTEYSAISSIQDSLVEKICVAARGNFRFSEESQTASMEEEDLLPGAGTDLGKVPSTDDEDFGQGSGELEFTL